MLSSTSALAGGLEVSPTTLQLGAQQNAEGITLSNVGGAPIQAQVRVFAWNQKDREDLLAPTTELTVSPPMLQIAPGGKQLLRVIRTSAAPSEGTEKSYRLIIDELPPMEIAPDSPQTETAAPKGKSKAQAGVAFLMRYSLPVFVGNSTNPLEASQLVWTLDKSTNPWMLKVENRGSTRAQVADVRGLQADGAPTTLAQGLVGYVLAGQSMQWSIQPPQPITKITGYDAMINRVVQPINVTSSP